MDEYFWNQHCMIARHHGLDTICEDGNDTCNDKKRRGDEASHIMIGDGRGSISTIAISNIEIRICAFMIAPDAISIANEEILLSTSEIF